MELLLCQLFDITYIFDVTLTFSKAHQVAEDWSAEVEPSVGRRRGRQNEVVEQHHIDTNAPPDPALHASSELFRQMKKVLERLAAHEKRTSGACSGCGEAGHFR